MAFTVQQIAEALGAEAEGDMTLRLNGPAQPEMAEAHDLALAMNPKFLPNLAGGQAKVAVLPKGTNWQALGLKAAIFAPHPRYVLRSVNQLYAPVLNTPPGIHPSAVVSPSARIGSTPSIGPLVVVADGVVIGDNARILSHCSIGQGVVIGDDCLLYEGARIGAGVTIGDRFIAQPNAVIGSDGFSYVNPEPGALEAARAGAQPAPGLDYQRGFARINSLGAVVVGDDVEIGAGACVDRGTIIDTRIGNGTKIDNLVQLGHNVQIGAHCLLCAQVGVGGSATISDRVILAGQVGVADHVTIGTNVVAAGKSGISSNVPPNRFIMGNPAIKADANVESYKAYRRLPKLVAKVESLQKQVSKLLKND